jgi:hypothetical protein
MVSKTLARRLERLAARDMPNSPRVMKILVTRIGQPDRIIELPHTKPIDQRQGLGPTPAGGK